MSADNEINPAFIDIRDDGLSNSQNSQGMGSDGQDILENEAFDNNVIENVGASNQETRDDEIGNELPSYDQITDYTNPDNLPPDAYASVALTVNTLDEYALALIPGAIIRIREAQLTPQAGLPPFAILELPNADQTHVKIEINDLLSLHGADNLIGNEWIFAGQELLIGPKRRFAPLLSYEQSSFAAVVKNLDNYNLTPDSDINILHVHYRDPSNQSPDQVILELPTPIDEHTRVQMSVDDLKKIRLSRTYSLLKHAQIELRDLNKDKNIFKGQQLRINSDGKVKPLISSKPHSAAYVRGRQGAINTANPIPPAIHVSDLDNLNLSAFSQIKILSVRAEENNNLRLPLFITLELPDKKRVQISIANLEKIQVNWLRNHVEIFEGQVLQVGNKKKIVYLRSNREGTITTFANKLDNFNIAPGSEVKIVKVRLQADENGRPPEVTLELPNQYKTQVVISLENFNKIQSTVLIGNVDLFEGQVLRLSNNKLVSLISPKNINAATIVSNLDDFNLAPGSEIKIVSAFLQESENGRKPYVILELPNKYHTRVYISLKDFKQLQSKVLDNNFDIFNGQVVQVGNNNKLVSLRSKNNGPATIINDLNDFSFSSGDEIKMLKVRLDNDESGRPPELTLELPNKYRTIMQMTLDDFSKMQVIQDKVNVNIFEGQVWQIGNNNKVVPLRSQSQSPVAIFADLSNFFLPPGSEIKVVLVRLEESNGNKPVVILELPNKYKTKIQLSLQDFNKIQTVTLKNNVDLFVGQVLQLGNDNKVVSLKSKTQGDAATIATDLTHYNLPPGSEIKISQVYRQEGNNSPVIKVILELPNKHRTRILMAIADFDKMQSTLMPNQMDIFADQVLLMGNNNKVVSLKSQSQLPATIATDLNDFHLTPGSEIEIRTVVLQETDAQKPCVVLELPNKYKTKVQLSLIDFKKIQSYTLSDHDDIFVGQILQLGNNNKVVPLKSRSNLPATVVTNLGDFSLPPGSEIKMTAVKLEESDGNKPFVILELPNKYRTRVQLSLNDFNKIQTVTLKNNVDLFVGQVLQLGNDNKVVSLKSKTQGDAATIATDLTHYNLPPGSEIKISQVYRQEGNNSPVIKVILELPNKHRTRILMTIADFNKMQSTLMPNQMDIFADQVLLMGNNNKVVSLKSQSDAPATIITDLNDFHLTPGSEIEITAGVLEEIEGQKPCVVLELPNKYKTKVQLSLEDFKKTQVTKLRNNEDLFAGQILQVGNDSKVISLKSQTNLAATFLIDLTHLNLAPGSKIKMTLAELQPDQRGDPPQVILELPNKYHTTIQMSLKNFQKVQAAQQQNNIDIFKGQIWQVGNNNKLVPLLSQSNEHAAVVTNLSDYNLSPGSTIKIVNVKREGENGRPLQVTLELPNEDHTRLVMAIKDFNKIQSAALPGNEDIFEDQVFQVGAGSKLLALPKKKEAIVVSDLNDFHLNQDDLIVIEKVTMQEAPNEQSSPIKEVELSLPDKDGTHVLMSIGNLRRMGSGGLGKDENIFEKQQLRIGFGKKLTPIKLPNQSKESSTVTAAVVSGRTR